MTGTPEVLTDTITGLPGRIQSVRKHDRIARDSEIPLMVFFLWEISWFG